MNSVEVLRDILKVLNVISNDFVEEHIDRGRRRAITRLRVRILVCRMIQVVAGMEDPSCVLNIYGANCLSTYCFCEYREVGDKEGKKIHPLNERLASRRTVFRAFPLFNNLGNVSIYIKFMVNFLKC